MQENIGLFQHQEEARVVRVQTGERKPQSQFIEAEGVVVSSASSAYDLTFKAAALILKLS